ncbi:MAG: hypothetical protein MJ149_02005 [Clostridia bacterium]|nr:hypothetical protein [Clostridia bacterium]
MRKLLSLFNESAKTRRVYDRLLNNQEKKEKSVRLGVRAIIYSLLVVLFGALLGLGFKLFTMVAGAEVGLIFITILGGIACVVAGISGTLSNFFGALSATRYQFRLNKKAIRWVALVAVVLCALAAVVVGLVVAGVIA